MSSSPQALAASFRDPAGCLFAYGDRILRMVNPAGVPDLTLFLDSRTAQKHLAAGSVAGTRLLEDPELRDLLADPRLPESCRPLDGGIILEHERISFPSFPYEWPPEMLHAAGALTLELATSLLNDGLGLKDATPYNVLFRGPQPVFIDVLSFERRDPGDSTWLPYAQFVRTFLLPLLANRYFGIAIDQILTTRRDGLEPEEVYRWLKPLQKIRPPFLSLVSMPKWLGARHKQDDNSIYQKRPSQDPERARFVLGMLLKGLHRTLSRLAPPAGKQSAWSDYMTSNNNYTAEHFAAKQSFVRHAVEEFRPKRVLDIGCNTGHFSALAARAGAEVVALDYDPVVLGDVWRNARAESLNILPLAVNLTRPTPGIGWRNRENASFLDRARGHFDATLMLAVIHHMLVTERVPLVEIMDLAAELTNRILIIEFIAPEDSMFRRLTRGREGLHRDLTPAMFESVCSRRFEIVRTQHLEGTSRWLYLLAKKTG